MGAVSTAEGTMGAHHLMWVRPVVATGESIPQSGCPTEHQFQFGSDVFAQNLMVRDEMPMFSQQGT